MIQGTDDFVQGGEGGRSYTIPLLTPGYLLHLPSHPKVSFTSPFSPQGIFYIPLLIPGESFTFPFSPQGIFYIPLLTPGYLLPPSHPKMSFTSPFSP